MLRYEILNDAGQVVNTILADESFVSANYPGHYRLIEELVVEDNSADHALQSSNYASVKVVNINRLLSKGLVSKALKLNGGF